MSHPEPIPEERLGSYRVLDVVAQGGMGIVYRARDERDGTIVALKTVFSERAEHIASIRREVEALRRIRHPGVVRVLDHGLTDGVPWYAMELLEGRSLRDVMSVRTAARTEPSITMLERRTAPTPDAEAEVTPAELRLPLAEAIRLVHRICEPLAFLHGEGVVHRDLKPSNVFLRGGTEPVLVDFGLVQRFGGSATREMIHEGEGPPAGTYLYMSPEQLAEGVLDPRADLYALGCLLYELVVGRPPFRGSAPQLTLQHLRADPPSPTEIVPGLPASVEALIMRLLEKRPRNRIGYAVDVAAALESIAHELGAPLEPVVDAGAPSPRVYLYRPEIAGRRALLNQVAEALEDPTRRLILLRGPSGIGKTRVATELARRVRLRGQAKVAKGACEPLSGARPGIGRGAPLHGLRAVLREIADHCRARGPAEVERVLGPRAAVLAMYEPSLEELAGVSSQTATWLPSAESSRARLLSWLAETLSEYGRVEPVVVFLDDAQWADEVTLAFLKGIGEGVVPLRNVHVVCTCRDDSTAEAELRGLPHVRDVPIGALDRDAIAELIGDMLGRARAPSHLVDLLAERSGGNPFHVGEFLHAAVAQGVLCRPYQSAWALSDDAGIGLMPSSVEELVAVRIESYGQATRSLLNLLAAIGHEAPPALLTAASELDDADVLAVTGELIARDILAEGQDAVLRFRHATLRDTIYHRIEPEPRRALHRVLAEVMASLDRPDARELAVHWDRAGDAARAAPHYLEAARLAQRKTASAQACELFERGFALEAQAGIRPVPDRARSALELAYGQALSGVGRLEDAEGALRKLLGSLGTPLPTGRAGWLAHAARQGLEHLSGSNRPADRSDGASHEELALIALEALSSILLARADTLGQIGAALTGGNLAARAPDGPASSMGHGKMALLAGLAGLESSSERYLARAHRAAPGSHPPPSVYVAEALVCLARGRWSRLTELLGPAKEACTAAGDYRARIQIQLFGAGAALVRGRADECLSIVERLLPEAQERGYAVETVHLLSNRVGARILKADAGGAGDALGEMGAALDGGGDPVARTLLHVFEGSVALLEEDPRARALADRAFLEMSKVGRGSPGFLVHHLFLPAIYLGLAQRGERGALEPAARAASQLGGQARMQPAAGPTAALFGGVVARLRGHGWRAKRQLGQATRRAAELDLPWTEGVARYERACLAGPEAGSDDARGRSLLLRCGAAHPPYYVSRPAR